MAASDRQSAGEVTGRVKSHANLKGGSRKGVPNKNTAAIKDMILKALDEAGGAEYLQRQAEANPSAFMTLIGKVLPMQVTGEDGGAIKAAVEVIFRRD